MGTTKRKGLSKKIRFEVFKRDKFTCQYCGRKAPDVILEVDHIKPISKGGTNDLMNLVTACKDCNRGKTNIELSDDSVVKKQEKIIQDRAEKKEQLEMYIEWRDSLKEIEEQKIDIVCNKLKELAYINVRESGRKRLKKLIKEFGLGTVLDAVDISVETYKDTYDNWQEVVYSKLGGICHNITRENRDQFYYYNYLKKSCYANFDYCNEHRLKTIVYEHVITSEDFNWVKKELNETNSFNAFCKAILSRG